jgi:hypothetical protein
VSREAASPVHDLVVGVGSLVLRTTAIHLTVGVEQYDGKVFVGVT